MIGEKNIYEIVGRNLRELRKARNLTQAEIGARMGISNTSVVNYETGTRKIPLEYLLKFAQFYGVTVDFLMENSPEPIIDDSIAVSARYARMWRDGGEIRRLTSKEARQIYQFAKFIISQRKEND